MAKGDQGRVRNEANYQGQRNTALAGNLRTGTLEPQLSAFRNYYQDMANRQNVDYGNIMGQYQDFARTGGYSPTDLASIRSRAISPTRAAYARGMENIARNAALQGGYSPGRSILQARLGRDIGTAGSEAANAAEANIAQLQNQGRQFGVAGQQSLYGTTPAAAATFGNQVLQGTNQLLTGTGMEMGQGQQNVGNQIAAAQIPSSADVALGRVGQIANMATGAIYPWLNPGGGAQALPAQVPGSYASNLYQSGGWGQPGVY